MCLTVSRRPLPGRVVTPEARHKMSGKAPGRLSLPPARGARPGATIRRPPGCPPLPPYCIELTLLILPQCIFVCSNGFLMRAADIVRARQKKGGRGWILRACPRTYTGAALVVLNFIPRLCSGAALVVELMRFIPTRASTHILPAHSHHAKAALHRGDFGYILYRHCLS